MPSRIRLEWLAIVFIFCTPADARIHRSHTAIAEFKRAHPCPATGLPTGPCLGWIIDHIEPLCAGGVDHPGNMQWQTKADSLVKDREEWATCRALRKQ